MSLEDYTSKPHGLFSPQNDKAQRGLGVIIAVILGIVGFNYAIPFLLTFLSGAFQIALYLGFFGLVAFLALNKQVAKAAGFLFQSFMTGFWLRAIRKDPIGIMKMYLRRMGRSLIAFSRGLTNIRAAIKEAESEKATYTDEREEFLNTLRGAKEQGIDIRTNPTLVSVAEMLSRRETSIVRLDNHIVLLGRLLDRLGQIYNDCKAKHLNLDDKIKHHARERRSVLAIGQAVTSAIDIMKGGSFEAGLAAQAEEYLRQEAATVAGQFEQFMFETRDEMEIKSLRDAGAVERLLDRLDQSDGGTLAIEHKPGDVIHTPTPDVGESLGIERFLKKT
jgi:hypothetical protein